MAGWVAGATVLGAVIGAGASGNAADAQLQGSRESAAVQREMFNKNVELQAPFREAGLKGQNELMNLLGLSGDTGAKDYGTLARSFTGQDMYKDPGYAFRLNEGVKALDRSAAARGGLLGGNQLRGVTQFGQDYASGEFMNAFNRYQAERQARLNPLQSLTGQAQTSANTLGNAATGLGNQLGAAAVDAGNIRASGYMGTANAISGAIGTGVNYYTNKQAQDRQQRNFDRMMGQYGGSSGGGGDFYP
jgi:hypothetical protein